MLWVLLCGGMVSLWLIVVLPTVWISSRCTASGTDKTSEKDKLDLEIKFRDILIKTVAAILTLVGVWIGWLQYVGKSSLDLFGTAVKLVSSQNEGERISGLYILSRLGEADCKQYQWQFIDLTLTLLRRQASEFNDEDKDRIKQHLSRLDDSETDAFASRSLPPADIQAALTVIGSRNPEKELQHVPLYWEEVRDSNTAMSSYSEGLSVDEKLKHPESLRPWLDFSGLDLTFCSLSSGHFEGCILHSSHLEGASLVSAHMSRSFMPEAKLAGSYLQDGNFSDCFLKLADFSQANAAGSHFEGAYLYGANFTRAELSQALFGDADVAQCIFEGADLADADLSKVSNLSWTNLKEASELHGAKVSASIFRTEADKADAANAGVLIADEKQ